MIKDNGTSTENALMEVTLSEKTINDLNMLIDKLVDKIYWRFNNNNKKEDKNDAWPRTPVK